MIKNSKLRTAFVRDKEILWYQYFDIENLSLKKTKYRAIQ